MRRGDLPPDVERLSEAFIAELDRTLGPRVHGLFLYGAVCFPPSPVSDFDAHVLVDGPFTDDDRQRIWTMLGRLRRLPLGDELDVWYVTVDAARSAEAPQTELKPGFRDTAWALHRAHIHAGRFIGLLGPDPREVVPVPTWSEIDASLQAELDYVDEHVADAPAFCVLNLCRILYSYTTRDVVVGKLQAGIWAHAVLDATEHALVRRAISSYADRTYLTGEDVRGFQALLRARIGSARG